MISFKYLLKLYLWTFTLGVRASIYEFGGREAGHNSILFTPARVSRKDPYPHLGFSPVFSHYLCDHLL